MWAIIKSAYARMRVGEGYQFVWRERARGGEKCLEAVGKRSLGTIDWEWGEGSLDRSVEMQNQSQVPLFGGNEVRKRSMRCS